MISLYVSAEKVFLVTPKYACKFHIGKVKPPHREYREGVYCVRSLTMTYFRMEEPHYHWRRVVSLSCSGWEGVGPTRYGRQTNCSASSAVLLFALFVVT